MKTKLAVLAIMFVMISYASIALPPAIGAVSGSWTQTSQADWLSDTLTNLDASNSPGYVKIASGGSAAQMGLAPINRTSYCCSGFYQPTVINLSPGSAAPVSGLVFAYEFYAANTAGQLRLKIFRDNSTYYNLVGQGPLVSMNQGYNYYSLPSPISVQRGDLLAAYWTGDLSNYDLGLANSEAYVLNGDQGSSSHSTWTYFSIDYSLQADIRPTVVGTLLSTIKDTGGTSTWSAINWTATTPQGTQLSFNTRSSNDSIIWSPWSTNYTTTGSPIKSPGGRYVQYQAVFVASGNSTQTPTLHNVTLSYSTSPLASSSSPFLSTYLPWIILAAVVAGFAAAVILTKPKAPKSG